MLVISKVSLFHQERRINNKNNTLSLRRNELRDSVSFKKREELFLTKLRELYKNGWNGQLVGKIQIIAHDVDPKHPEVIAEFKRIEEDLTIGEGVKNWILKELPKLIGIGGNTIL